MIPEVTAYIRFQLEQLGARNAHHEFEHLCRHLARSRICSNILPATGPVASGGDQGRDFETFRSYLSSSPLANSAFVGLVSDRPLAFACSLQREIKPKIRHDLTTIAQSGQPVEGVHYFCTAPVPVSERHKLQEWARETHGLSLEIYDGEAIAEMLADGDTFWIAARYLGVPSELYPSPQPNDSDEWYQEALRLWKESGQVPLSYANFEIVKSAARLATEDPARRAELTFWIDRLQRFISNDAPLPLRRRAIYEKSVASLKGTGSLEGLEDDLRAYFTDVASSAHTSDLQDASALIMFCYGAIQHHAVQLDLAEVREWRDALETEVDDRLSNALGPNSKSELLEVRGYLSLTRDPGDWNGVEECIEWWIQLTDLLADAPLFPLEQFADRLTGFVAFIGDATRYTELTHRVDNLLAARTGQFAAAQRARDRAMAFYKQGRLLRAITELHEAKVKWYAEETLKGSVLAMLFISHCYRELHLHYAAKYYSLAATFIAFQANDPNVRQLLPRALTHAAESDYDMGNWYEFLHFSHLAMLAHWQHARNAGDFDSHDELERIWFHATLVLVIAEMLDERLSSVVNEQVYSWGLDDWFDELIPRARQAWQKRNLAEMLSSVEDQIAGRLFGDLDLKREVVWSQLGIVWRFNWQNDYSHNQRAQQLIAILQIALADLARHDLYLLRTTVSVEVVVTDVPDERLTASPSNDGREWRVVLPFRGQSVRDVTIHAFSMAVTLLRDASLMPNKRFEEVLDDAFRQGILSKIMVGRPYEDLYREFIEPTSIDERPALPDALVDRRSVRELPVHEELAWVADNAIGYSAEEAEAAIRRRYEESRRLFPVTLDRLRVSRTFQRVLQQLRNERWRDWHILLAVGNVALNYRLTRLEQRIDLSFVSENDRQRFVMAPEDEQSPVVPTEEFNADRLQFALGMSMLSTLGLFGLECHQMTPDLPAIRDFLEHRCHFWTDDVDHADPFG